MRFSRCWIIIVLLMLCAGPAFAWMTPEFEPVWEENQKASEAVQKDRSDRSRERESEQKKKAGGPSPGDTWTEPVTGMEFVWVEGGCYMMGQTESEKQYLIDERGKDKYKKYYSDERPRHKVCVDGFWMGKYEVTNRQYRLFDSGHSSKDYKGVDLNQDNQPVADVSWKDARKFVEWLNRKTGQEFSLPTEAQWEYAARAGTDTIRFWGDSADDACRYANVADLTAKRKWSGWTVHDCSDGYAGSAPKGSFKPNDFGLYDMLGNVWEWCEDVYDDDAYTKHSRNNPLVASGGSRRVFRGGNWRGDPWGVRAANRNWIPADSTGSNLGFRLCLSRVR
mgnify:CR=1 FL=1